MNQISFGSLANFNSVVPWGLWVAIYIWLVGVSAGSFLLIIWGNLRNNVHLKKVTRLGIILSIAALSAGLLSIQIDLGHIERFYKLFNSPNPTSVMAWMVWLYGFYFAILAVTLLYCLKKDISKVFLGFAFMLSLAVIITESLLFALPPGKHWHSLIFPIHFLTSSLLSAIAALILNAGIFWGKKDKPGLLSGLGKVALPFIIINIVVEIMDVIIVGGIGNIENWFLVAGYIIALALLLKNNSASIIASGAIALVTVLLSKYSTLISAQLIEPFKGFGKAYIEPKLQFNYAPTAFELFASVFLAGLVAVIFYVLYKVFPLTREE